MGDPTTRNLPLYLPQDYDNQVSRRYPVVWVLAPFASWGERLFNVQAWDENIVQMMDRLIGSGKIQPMIMAFPDCFTRYGGSQYLNSTAIGDYERYITSELIPLVDLKFRTMPDSKNRGVIGHSSGGYGAFMLGMRHSDLFGAVACHSGDMMFEQCYWPDIAGAVRCWQSAGSIEKFVMNFPNIRDKGKDWGSALSIVAMSACYSPNRDSPLGFDLICDPYSGEIREEIWARWKSFDPVRIASMNAKALNSLNLLYFDCGTRDEYNLFLGARALHRALERAEVQHIYQEHDGGHQRINWRYEVSLTLLSSVLIG